MTTFARWVDGARVHRCYEVFGSDAVIRADALDEIITRCAAEQVVRLDAGERPAEQIWNEVEASPLEGRSRVIVLQGADRLGWWDPLQSWLAARAFHVGTTLVLVCDRAQRGKRRRNRNTGKWETELEPWQLWVEEHSAAIAIECATPSAEVTGLARGKQQPSSVATWLSRRVPVTQRQAEYLWRRVGGRTALARDVLIQLRLLGLSDATVLGRQDFADRVDALITAQGAESLVEDVLFGRRQTLAQTLADRELDRREWSRVIGLLGQRLEWLEPLHHALRSRESLSTVSNRLGIHQNWILRYAHREDPSHNIAKYYTPQRVARCRRLLADLDAALAQSRSVPAGFGETLLASW